MSILIVDDNIKFIERMMGLLNNLDNIATIKVATGYEEAHRHLFEEMPDVVLLDISLPGKNGIELLRAIQKAELTCDVIMLTNNSNEYYRHLCSQLGAKYFLDKTIEFGKVPGIINQLSLN